MLKITNWKLASQIVCFGIIVYLGYAGVRLIEWKNISLVLPTLSCYYTDHRIAQCFLRALQEGLSGGWKVVYSSLLPTLALLVILGLLFGRSWCSWVCPLGFIQDVFIRVRKYLRIGYYNLSDKLKLASVFVRWFLVISLVVVAVDIGITHFVLPKYKYDFIAPNSVYCQLCPSKAIFPCVEGRFKEMLPMDNILKPFDSMNTPLATTMAYLAAAIFIFYLVTTSFIRRMWCRLCPMGAILGEFNRFSLLTLRKEGKRCTKCGICKRSCPVQIEEVYEEKEKEKIVSSECTLCYRCVEMCPEKDALKIGFFKFPIARSRFRRFIQSAAVKAKKSKRRITSEQKQ